MSDDPNVRDLRSKFGRGTTPEEPSDEVPQEGPEEPPAATDGDKSAAWPSWAVVDWDALEGGTSAPVAAAYASAVAPTIRAPEPETLEPEPEDDEDLEAPEAPQAPAEPLEAQTDEPSETYEPESEPRREAARAEVVSRPPIRDLEDLPLEPGSALSLTPERLWELIQEAAIAAQEARERAARAEGESEVLRTELERLREERNVLTDRLTTRRSWFPWRRRTP